MSADIWDILHDGTIISINGTIPGEIAIIVEIKYLRHMFSKDGDLIIVLLHDCELLRLEQYEPQYQFESLLEIASKELWILSAEEKDGIIQVACQMGILKLKYGSLDLELDNKTRISVEQLEKVCITYWDNFGKKE